MVGGEQLMGSTLDCVGVTLGQGVAGCVDGGKAGAVWIGGTQVLGIWDG